MWMQFKAMFVKRFLNSKREKKAVVTQIVLPLLLVLCGLLLSVSRNTQEDDPSLKLSLEMLKDKSDGLTAFYADFTNYTTDKSLMKQVIIILLWSLKITYITQHVSGERLIIHSMLPYSFYALLCQNSIDISFPLNTFVLQKLHFLVLKKSIPFQRYYIIRHIHMQWVEKCFFA